MEPDQVSDLSLALLQIALQLVYYKVMNTQLVHLLAFDTLI